MTTVPTTFDTTESPAETAALVHAIERHAGFQTVDLDTDAKGQLRIAVVPAGKELKSLQPFLDELRTEPKRRRGVAKLESLPGFIAHVQRFAGVDSAIFAAGMLSGQPVLRAVYDYHPANADVSDARTMSHQAEYPLTLSPEWQAWERVSGQPLTPTQFAAFLEDRIADVYQGEPSERIAQLVRDFGLMLAGASKLVELSKKLEVSAKVNVKQAQNLSTGEIAVSFEETHADGAGQPIRVPNAFQIAIPVFAGASPFVMLVRLAYRRTDSGIVWFVRVHDAARVRAAAAEEVCEAVRSATSVPLYHGLPESTR